MTAVSRRARKSLRGIGLALAVALVASLPHLGTARALAGTPALIDTPAPSHADPIDAWRVKTVNLPVSHATYDASRDIVLATVAPTNANVGNELVEMDPHTAAIGRHVYVGSQPARIALTDDNTTAYVTLAGASSITKVDLASFMVTGHIALPVMANTTLTAEDVATRPGFNDQFVAVVNGRAGTDHHLGVMAFANGAALPNWVQGFTNRIEVVDGFHVFGFYTSDTTPVSVGMSWDDTGLHSGPIPSTSLSNGEMVGDEFVTVTGDAINPTTGAIRLDLPTSGDIAPSPEEDLLTFVTADVAPYISQWSLATGEQKQIRRFTNDVGPISELTATATDYVAVGNNKLYFIGTGIDVAAPTPLPAAEAPTIGRYIETSTAIKTNDIVWDGSRNLLYASVTTEGPWGGQVIAIDPVTHEVVKSVLAGGFPTAIAISGDNTKLWVAHAGRGAIVIVDLNTFLWGGQMPTGAIGDTVPVVRDMEAVPGTPDSFAATLDLGNGSQAVGLYKAKQRMPVLVGLGYKTPQVIHFASATDLYGQNNAFGEFEFTHMKITDNGLTVVGSPKPMTDMAGGDFDLDPNGVAWFTNGQAFNPATPTLVASLPSTGPLELRGGRVVQFAHDSYAKPFVYEYDAKGRRIAAVALRDTAADWTQSAMTRLADGFVVRSGDGLTFFTPPRCVGKPITIFGPSTFSYDTPTTINGTAGNDVILGTPGPDVINAGGGNDVICGLGSNDTIVGGLGNDYIMGGEGNDTLDGSSGTDFLFGGLGDDALRGSAGNDRLDGGLGADDIDGGTGTDIFSLATADTNRHIVSLDNVANDGILVGGGTPDGDNVHTTVEIVIGTPGWDQFYGSDNNEWFLGMGNTDEMWGGGGNDQLDGGAGDDFLSGDAGNDVMYGGTGADVCEGGPGTNRSFDCEHDHRL